jgi:TonB-dependent receptor
LPAASLIYEVVTNMNIRLSFGRTIARPTFRELAATRTFDFIGGENLRGNPDLVISQIANYDLRWEWFRRPGEVFAVSFFYKEIEDPIEKAQVGNNPIDVQYVNSPEATVLGVEVEARTALDVIDPLLRNFSIGANFAYIESETTRSERELRQRMQFFVPGEATRPLYDQSPYVINADLSYDSPRSGTTVSLVFNVSGPRLTFAGFSVPDIFEQPAPRLDLLLSQRLGKNWRLKAYAKNLLNPEVEQVYDFTGPSGEEYVYSSYTKGIEFGLGVSYQF